MIYIDSSVALAYLLAESAALPPGFWDMALVSSRLLQYEMWNRLHARQPARLPVTDAGALLAGVQLVEMSEIVLARALEPWATPIRTLDALHLATVEYLRRQGEPVELASYDNRLRAAAAALGIPMAAL